MRADSLGRPGGEVAAHLSHIPPGELVGSRFAIESVLRREERRQHRGAEGGRYQRSPEAPRSGGHGEQVDPYHIRPAHPSGPPLVSPWKTSVSHPREVQPPRARRTHWSLGTSLESVRKKGLEGTRGYRASGHAVSQTEVNKVVALRGRNEPVFHFHTGWRFGHASPPSTMRWLRQKLATGQRRL